MSFNGSGTFVINTAGQPVVANTVISATVFNALTSDLATGLSTCITKDGQTTVTANIPFGNNKITSLGAGTAATDASNMSQVQSTAAKLITVTGTDTITGTMSPALASYAAGQLFYFIANAANTGAMTINIDGLGAKSITRDGSTALIAGDVNTGEIVVICYDGTRFQMINAANSFGNTTINGTLTVTGNTGLQANVSITSALSVGGVFAVTGAATLGSTLAVTGKSDLPTVSTASMNAAVAVVTTGTVTNLTSTSASIASMNAGVALLTTATVTTLTATGASIASANLGNAVISSMTLTGASVASANVGTATITGNLTLSGGTANGVLYLNGSKVATSGSALTFDGTNFASTGIITSTNTNGLRAQYPVSAAYYGQLDSRDGNTYLSAIGSTAAIVFSATNAGNTTAEGMRLTSTGLGIGTASPETKLDIVGTSGTEQFRIGNTSGGTDFGINVTENVGAVINSAEGATARSIQFQTGGTNTVFISTAGAVGIGTSSPAEKLEVEFSTNGYILADNSTDTNTGIKFANTGRTYGIFTDGGSGASNSLRFFDFTANADRMRINNDGNLGLGVTPSAWNGTFYKVIEGGDANNQSAIGFRQDVNGIALFTNTVLDSGGNKYKFTGTAGQYAIEGNAHIWSTAPSGTAGNAITFTQAMTLDASGNLGVGTTSPSRRLHVYSTGNIPVRIETNTSDTKIEILTSSGTQYVQGSVNDLLFGTNNTERGRFTAGGDFLVGTTTTSSLAGAGRGLIEVNGSSDSAFAMKANNTLYGYLYNSASEFRVANVTSNPVTFFTNNTERARITSAGLVGIGTTSPTATLEVNASGGGTVRVTRSSVSSNYLQLSHDGTNGTVEASGANALLFSTNGTERGRFAAEGYFRASNNGTYLGGNYHELRQSAAGSPSLYAYAASTSYVDSVVYISANMASADTYNYLRCVNNTGNCLFIQGDGDVINVNGTYGTISDAKMKTDIVDAGSQWDDVKAIRFRKFKMKDDPQQITQLGVVAQELEQTSPGLINEHTDKDKDGNDLGTTTKSVKTSVLLMKAAVALQEAMARIEQLEAKVAVLESK
jgi:hypothetical protein